MISIWPMGPRLESSASLSLCSSVAGTHCLSGLSVTITFPASVDCGTWLFFFSSLIFFCSAFASFGSALRAFLAFTDCAFAESAGTLGSPSISCFALFGTPWSVFPPLSCLFCFFASFFCLFDPRIGFSETSPSTSDPVGSSSARFSQSTY